MNGQSAAKSIFSGSAWGIMAKIFDAGAKFVTIPLLVGYYGKADYGLVALAFSLNAYLRLMDLGMNIGSVRFFSMWVAREEWGKISKVSRSSIVFYGSIGLINAGIFLFMSDYGQYFFNLESEQVPIYRWMMYILAASAVFNWLYNVVIQLLSAKDELGYVHRITVISSILNFAIALLAINLGWSLTFYFLLYTLSNLIPLPLNILRLKVFPLPLASLITPNWDGKAFKEIIGYSMAIFLMGLFQLTANELRPILLAKFASGLDVLTDYRVIQTIAMLIVSFGGIFLQVLLPSASKIYAENDLPKMEKMVLEATKYISVFLCLIVFLLILNASDLLLVYMGEDYQDLSLWLIIWLLTVLLSMHNTPVASLVLSSGKTRFLIYSSATACVLSLPITVIFAPTLNVGAAVIGYFVYMIIQIGFFYVYYIPRVLMLNNAKIFFGSFSPSVLGALFAFGISHYFGVWIGIPEGMLAILAKSAVFVLIYAGFHLAFVVKPDEIRHLKQRLIDKDQGEQ
ncbi:MAG TPA: oligosaccharide flippase family protein [Cyclobacteriaceae bacterium]|nr:oligosaccharide flippase family protein [Cyclobacteriaceae bacterium]